MELSVFSFMTVVACLFNFQLVLASEKVKVPVLQLEEVDEYGFSSEELQKEASYLDLKEEKAMEVTVTVGPHEAIATAFTQQPEQQLSIPPALSAIISSASSILSNILPTRSSTTTPSTTTTSVEVPTQPLPEVPVPDEPMQVFDYYYSPADIYYYPVYPYPYYSGQHGYAPAYQEPVAGAASGALQIFPHPSGSFHQAAQICAQNGMQLAAVVDGENLAQAREVARVGMGAGESAFIASWNGDNYGGGVPLALWANGHVGQAVDPTNFVLCSA